MAPGVATARTAWARLGIELCDEGLWPGVAKARTAWMRHGLELRDADLWSSVGNARAVMVQSGIELDAQAERLWQPGLGPLY